MNKYNNKLLFGIMKSSSPRMIPRPNNSKLSNSDHLKDFISKNNDIEISYMDTDSIFFVPKSTHQSSDHFTNFYNDEVEKDRKIEMKERKIEMNERLSKIHSIKKRRGQTRNMFEACAYFTNQNVLNISDIIDVPNKFEITSRGKLKHILLEYRQIFPEIRMVDFKIKDKFQLRRALGPFYIKCFELDPPLRISKIKIL